MLYGETNNDITVISCIYGFLNNDFNSSDFVASIDRITSEKLIWKEMKRSVCVTQFEVLSQYLPGGMEENQEILAQNGQSLGRFESEVSRMWNRRAHYSTLIYFMYSYILILQWYWLFYVSGLWMELENMPAIMSNRSKWVKSSISQ